MLYKRLMVPFFMVLIVCACSGQSAYLSSSYTVERHFERNAYPRELTYYVCGTLKKTLALIALDPDLKFESTGWHQLNISDDIMMQWMAAMKRQPRIEHNTQSNGALIINPQGKRVGMLYTVWRFPEIRFPASDQIDISIPEARLRITNINYLV